MAGQKRTRSGDPKPTTKPPSQGHGITMADTPPCGQVQAPSTTAQPKASQTKAAPQHPATVDASKLARENSTVPPSDLKGKNDAARQTHHVQKAANKPTSKPTNMNTNTDTNSNRKTKHKSGRIQKRPRLPPNTTLSKRPLLHPALPSPFSSAANPKVLYITASSPFIPACKRIRSLLSQITKRDAQSAAEERGRGRGGRQRPGQMQGGGVVGAKKLEANGRLDAREVEASISSSAAAGAPGGGRGGRTQLGARGEEVYLKATGRAIPRALELGVKFQGEEDCYVRVEMGNVKAIDDVEVTSSLENGGEKGERIEEEDVPETRIRTLSTVTVCIGLL